jgi:putative PIN family toxin of toxin-antitoxin system
MKVVPDSMLWVSYVTHRDGPRHAALNRSADQRVRLFTSKYIIEEVERILTDKFEKPRRFVQLALQKILRMATEVELPKVARSYVAGDPGDDLVIQTALSGKADWIVTADKVLLELGKVQDVEIISLDEFLLRLPPE